MIARFKSYVQENVQFRFVLGCAITFIGAGLWGANGTMIKYMLDTYNMSPEWLVCVRELGACWLFLMSAYFVSRTQLVEAIKSKKALFDILLVGLVGVLGSNLCYVKAIEATNSATATIMQNLNIVLVLIYICFRKKRLPFSKEIIGVVLALVGTFLIATGGRIGELSLPVEGIFWGSGTALTAMLFCIMPVKLLDRYGNFVVNGIGMLACGIVFSLYVHPWNLTPDLDVVGWLMVVASVVLGTYGTYGLFLQGIHMIGSFNASLFGLGEPVLAIVTSIIFLGTAFTAPEMLGFVLISLMTFFVSNET